MADPVALAHDYLTQRGGAERVALALMDAFPSAPLYTSFFHPAGTFAEFDGRDVRTGPLDRLTMLRSDHRRALPMLATAWNRMLIDAGVAVCSSSGWAHGAQVTGRKIVYCHNPARWLYQSEQYLAESGWPARTAVRALERRLRRWDKRAAASADLYLCNSTAVRDRVLAAYGIEATVVPPPHAVDPCGETAPMPEVEPGFILCVSRLMPYKNIDAILDAFAERPDLRLVVVGEGPDGERLRARCPSNARFVGAVEEPQLRWLYANCAGLVAASFEDFGLTPLEAAAFGRPSAVLRWGGFLDTVVEGETGVFFDEPRATKIAAALDQLVAVAWDRARVLAQAERFSPTSFAEKIRSVVAEVEAS